MNINKKSLVVQSNRLVEAKYRLSVEEQKIIKILVSQIQKEDEDFKDYEFRIKDLAELLGNGTLQPLRCSARNHQKARVAGVGVLQSGNEVAFYKLRGCRARNTKPGQGTVAMCFDPKLKPLLSAACNRISPNMNWVIVLRFKGQLHDTIFRVPQVVSRETIKRRSCSTC
ncbi:MAG: replication initiation protein [Candidatus Competibacter sp.]